VCLIVDVEARRVDLAERERAEKQPWCFSYAP
jgi:hypothetical protein